MGDARNSDGDRAESEAGPVANKSKVPNFLRRIPNWLVWTLLLFWVLAAFFGTAGLYVTREAFFTTKDGQGIDRCYIAAPKLVEEGTAEPDDYCTFTGQHFGPQLPADYKTVSGQLIVDKRTLRRQYLETLTLPDFWLTVGLGGAAILALFVVARSTGTLRAGLAASISVVFLGLLLFPTFFTGRIDADLKVELVHAWQWIILFYFGSEAAVQAAKVVRPGNEGVAGDVGSATPEPRSD